MLLLRTSLGAALVALAVVGRAAAQEQAIRIETHGGGYNALTTLNDPGTADFQKIGYHLGAGAEWQFQKFYSVRGDFTFARNELQVGGAATGRQLDRFLGTVALQLQYPFANGFEPYVYFGGGVGTFHQVGTSGLDVTKGVGTGGIGLHYSVPQTNVGMFVEGIAMTYQLNNMGGTLAPYNKAQFEVGWCAGLSYRFPL